MYDTLTADTDALPQTAPARASGEARLGIGARTLFPFVVVGGAWDVVAHLGVFPPRLFPTLEQVAVTFFNLTISGILPHHALDTMVRLLIGFSIAGVIGVTI